MRVCLQLRGLIFLGLFLAAGCWLGSCDQVRKDPASGTETHDQELKPIPPVTNHFGCSSSDIFLSDDPVPVGQCVGFQAGRLQWLLSQVIPVDSFRKQKENVEQFINYANDYAAIYGTSVQESGTHNQIKALEAQLAAGFEAHFKGGSDPIEKLRSEIVTLSAIDSGATAVQLAGQFISLQPFEKEILAQIVERDSYRQQLNGFFIRAVVLTKDLSIIVGDALVASLVADQNGDGVIAQADADLLIRADISAVDVDRNGQHDVRDTLLKFYLIWKAQRLSPAAFCAKIDLTGDTKIDLLDFSIFQSCFNGPGQPPASGCLNPAADFNGDGSVDLNDFSMFQSCFGYTVTNEVRDFNKDGVFNSTDQAFIDLSKMLRVVSGGLSRVELERYFVHLGTSVKTNAAILLPSTFLYARDYDKDDIFGTYDFGLMLVATDADLDLLETTLATPYRGSVFVRPMAEGLEVQWVPDFRMPAVRGYHVSRKLAGSTDEFQPIKNVWITDQEPFRFYDQSASQRVTYHYCVDAIDEKGDFVEAYNHYSSCGVGRYGYETGAGSESVLILANSAYPDSIDVARYYAEKRNIPMPDPGNPCSSTHILCLDAPIAKRQVGNQMVDEDWISYDDYQARILAPVRDHLKNNGLAEKIAYLVPVYGMPLKIMVNPEATIYPDLSIGFVALDMLLATQVPEGGMTEANFMGHRFNRNYGDWYYIVSRIDGMTPELAKALVDRAIEGERTLRKNPGYAYFDMGGLDSGTYDKGMPDGGGRWANRWIEQGLERSAAAGLTTYGDYRGGDNPARGYGEFGGPYTPISAISAQNPIFDADGNGKLDKVMFYTGWYRIFAGMIPEYDVFEWMPGSVGIHIDSYAAWSLKTDAFVHYEWSWSDKWSWAGGALRRGLTATIGAVDEPGGGGIANPGAVFDALLKGMTFGEAAFQGIFSTGCFYAGNEQAIIGDPLYRPFGDSSNLQTVAISKNGVQVGTEVIEEAGRFWDADDYGGSSFFVWKKDPSRMLVAGDSEHSVVVSSARATTSGISYISANKNLKLSKEYDLAGNLIGEYLGSGLHVIYLPDGYLKIEYMDGTSAIVKQAQ